MTIEEQMARELALRELNERIQLGEIRLSGSEAIRAEIARLTQQIVENQSKMVEDSILITKRHVPNLLKDMEQRVAEQWRQKMYEQIYGSLPFSVYWDGPRVGRIQRWWWRAKEWVGNVWHAIKGGTIAND